MSSPDPVLLDLLDQVGLARNDVAELLAHVRQVVAADVAEAVETEIPTISFDQLGAVPGTTANSTIEAVRRRGCAIVRGTFERDQAEHWNRQIGDYLADNEFERVFAERYPDGAETGARIWGIYWSLPQVQARQHDRMVATRRFLNSIWTHESGGVTWFDPDHDIAYPDRLRRRAPGAVAPGLRAHSDSPSAGGWRIAENIEVFGHVLAGHPERYDPWDAAHRTTVDSETPVSATVFRAFQGWTALSEMHPCDGVLHLAAVPNAAAYSLVKGIADELGVEAEPTPAPRRAGPDELVLPALRPIPAVEPGDTVWWHGDLFHSVADASNDTRWGNVMYIGSSPRCERNDRYVETSFERFQRGTSPLDYPIEDFEVDFRGRAGIDDLNRTGRQQFGLEPIR
jgi:hypothetical protein